MTAKGTHRTEPRTLSCIPAYIGSSDESKELALILDVSASGARLLTRSPFEDGTRLDLTLYLSKDKSACPVTGHVVRSKPRPPDAGAWPFEIAVQFDEPITEYAKDIQELSERQANLGLFRKSKSTPPESA